MECCDRRAAVRRQRLSALPVAVGSGGTAAGVAGLARRVEDFVGQEEINRLGCRRHVGAFTDQAAAVLDQGLGVCGGDFILGGGGEGAVAGDVPGAQVAVVLGAVLVGIFLDTAATAVLELLDEVELLLVEAVFVIDGAIGVGQ